MPNFQKLKSVPHDLDQPILQVKNVSLRYDVQVALDDVSFELEAAERVAVVGPNGAGKSTLFKVISGLLQPTQGEIFIHGHQPNRHVCIAYVPQRSQVDWRFPVNVSDVVMMGRSSRVRMFRHPGKKDREFVQQCMDTMRISHLAKRQIGALSGGQQQRMSIARALAQEAELMLMDEPLSGLDVTAQKDILDILDRLREHQVTVIVALHDLDLAAKHFDKVMLLNKELIGFGRPEDVFTANRLTAAYGAHADPNGREAA